MLPKSIVKLKSKGHLLPVISGIGLLAISYLLISPVGTGGENASAWVYGDTGGSSDGSTISLTSSKSSISNTASSINNTISDTTNLTVTASGTSQYAIYVQETQNEGKLVNGSSALTQLSAERGYNDIDAGKWGYALAEGSGVSANGLTYKAVPSASTTAAYTGTTADSKPFTLVFAAKFADGNPAGHYTGQVLVSVAANPGEVTSGFRGLELMQELNAVECYKASIGETGQLRDMRDGKSYWVTKLKDGNCWMTQNLDYDDPNSTKVSAPSGWTSTDRNYRAYYDPGDYYYVDSSSWITCNKNATGLSACVGSGWLTSGDTHYHAGNYYSLASATNNTSKDVSSGSNAVGSICPAGWQLPTNSSKSDNGSFKKLAAVYNISNSSSGGTILRSDPMYFIPGGFVVSGNLDQLGATGNYWASTMRDNSYVYILSFGTNYANVDAGGAFYYGMSVRCLVQGS